MKQEKMIEILKADGQSADSAKRFSQNGTVIFEEFDFAAFFEEYMEEREADEDLKEFYWNLMIEHGKDNGFSWVEYNGDWYFIEYCL